MELESPVLITGGAGFIGANLVRRLLRNGIVCHLPVRPGTQRWRLPSQASIQVHDVDLLQPGAVEDLIGSVRPGTVFHLAAKGGHPQGAGARKAMLEDSVDGTANLLAALRKHPPTSLVYTGSMFELPPSNTIIRETDEGLPTQFRGLAKSRATRLCQEFSAATDTPVVCLRPYTVYGPWEDSRRLVPRVIDSALRNLTLELTGIRSAFDFVHVEDVVDALVRAGGVAQARGEVINVATGVESTPEMLVRAVEAVAGRTIDMADTSYPVTGREMPHCQVAISRAKEILAWEPAIDLHEGIKRYIDWIRANRGDQCRG